jgi:hypothetical protein
MWCVSLRSSGSESCYFLLIQIITFQLLKVRNEMMIGTGIFITSVPDLDDGSVSFWASRIR